VSDILIKGDFNGNLDRMYAAWCKAKEAGEAFCKARMQLFADPTTFWGKHRLDIADLEEVMNFPNDAYHNIPDADVDFRAMLLKRKYLNKLRLKLLKIYRQRSSVGDYASRYYARKNAAQLKRHIDTNQEERIAAYMEFRRQYYGDASNL
jgi:hypothetical protein